MGDNCQNHKRIEGGGVIENKDSLIRLDNRICRVINKHILDKTGQDVKDIHNGSKPEPELQNHPCYFTNISNKNGQHRCN